MDQINFNVFSHGPNKAVLVPDSIRVKKWYQYKCECDRGDQCLFLLFFGKIWQLICIFLTLQDKLVFIHILSIRIKFICTRCKTD
jgi:hypothetical protein